MRDAVRAVRNRYRDHRDRDRGRGQAKLKGGRRFAPLAESAGGPKNGNSVEQVWSANSSLVM